MNNTVVVVMGDLRRGSRHNPRTRVHAKATHGTVDANVKDRQETRCKSPYGYVGVFRKEAIRIYRRRNYDRGWTLRLYWGNVVSFFIEGKLRPGVVREQIHTPYFLFFFRRSSLASYVRSHSPRPRIRPPPNDSDVSSPLLYHFLVLNFPRHMQSQGQIPDHVGYWSMLRSRSL